MDIIIIINIFSCVLLVVVYVVVVLDIFLN